MSQYQFQYPQAFWLLLLVPVFVLIFIISRYRRRSAIRTMGDPLLVRALMPSYSPRLTIFRFALICLAFALGCIALANPRLPDASSAEARKGIDVVIALDVSNSMKATDVQPSRIASARQFISRLIAAMPDDRIGLVVFAGYAYAQMPLTFDRDAARMYTQTADPSQIAAQGTSIGDAFQKAELLFGDETERFRSVVLITDGETHDENALEACKEMAAKGVMINTVGIGSAEGSNILDSAGVPKKDATGAVVISKLNEDILKQIASTTNGTYVHLENSEAGVKAVTDQYAGIEKKALGDASQYNYETFYAWFLVPMLLILLADTFIPDRKKLAK